MSRKARTELKRGIDIVIALALLVLLSPLSLLVSLAIYVRLGRPVIYRQRRPGYKGRPFHVYKFRTMTKATHRANGCKMLDEERIGRLGRLIRRSSLDELPQLWNVLRGDMSLVGPRPLLMEYLPSYTSEQMRRHDVRPGITGLAQVSGRNNLPWDQRFELDVWYVDNWSISLDFRILFLSAKKVLLGEDVMVPGTSGLTKFNEQGGSGQ